MSTESNKPVLRHVLNAALMRPPSQQLVDISLGNPYNDRLGEKEKGTILDVKAQDCQGHQFQVEMQLVVTPSLPERMLYTWSHTFVRQLQAGDDERALKPLYAIWLVNEALPVEPLLASWKQAPVAGGGTGGELGRDYYHRYVLVDPERRTVLSEHLTIIVIELQRPINKERELSALDRWVLFFQEATMWDVNKPPSDMETPEIVRAVQSLDERSKREQDLDLHRHRCLWLMHEQHIRRDMLQNVEQPQKKAEAEGARHAAAVLEQESTRPSSGFSRPSRSGAFKQPVWLSSSSSTGARVMQAPSRVWSRAMQGGGLVRSGRRAPSMPAVTRARGGQRYRRS